MKVIFVCAITTLLLSGCTATPMVNGLITSDERRIWVMRNHQEVYRCADGGGDADPPRPVCVRAPLASAGGP